MINHDTFSYQYLLWVCGIALVMMIIFSYYYWTLPTDIMPKLGNYIQMISVFILTVGGIISVLTFKHQIEDRHRSQFLQYVNLNQAEINDIEKQFMNNPLLDRLYYQMYAHTPHVQRIKRMLIPSVETPEMLKIEQQMASIIFQKIADIYFCQDMNESPLEDNIEWINTFRRWMQSPILQSHWKILKEEHHPLVCHFIDHILLRSASER